MVCLRNISVDILHKGDTEDDDDDDNNNNNNNNNNNVFLCVCSVELDGFPPRVLLWKK
jgi:hypothetical protein